MNLTEFEAQAESLARMGTALRDEGSGSPLAYWHGVEPGELCISVSHDGDWLNVHLDQEDGGHVEVSKTPAASPEPLYGQPYKSLPPVDAVFLQGSDLVGAYLKTFDWPRDEPFNDNFPDPMPGEYERLYQETCPLYQSEIAAVLGGWHVPWPEGDWPALVDHELVLFTLLESEPWIEVFRTGDLFIVKQRMT